MKTTARTAIIVAALVICLALFAWLVWPTAWSPSVLNGTSARTNRFTKCLQVFQPGGWRTLGNDPRCWTPAERESRFPSSVTATVDPFLYTADAKEFDSVVEESGSSFPSDSSETVRRVAEKLTVIIRPHDDLPSLIVQNHSRCLISALNIELSWWQQKRDVQVILPDGYLQPGASVTTKLPTAPIPGPFSALITGVESSDTPEDLFAAKCAY